MGRGGINERILTGIRESTDDNKLFDFLKDILFEEAEHPSQWWWKETYKKKIEEYSKEWGDSNEN